MNMAAPLDRTALPDRTAARTDAARTDTARPPACASASSGTKAAGPEAPKARTAPAPAPPKPMRAPEPPATGQMLRQARGAMLLKLLAIATSYGFAMLMARLMGQQGFGVLGFFISVAGFLSVVGARGQQMAALRFVPSLLANARQGALERFAGQAIGRTLVGAVLAAALAGGGLLAARAFGALQGFGAADIVLGLALVPLVGGADILAHLARGHGFLALALAPKEILWRALTLLLCLGLAAGSGSGQIAPQTALGLMGAVLAGLLLGQWLGLRRRTGLALMPRPFPGATPWDAQIRPFWLGSVANIFLAHADVIAVGMLAGAKVAGGYFIANRLAMLLAFFQTAYNIVLGPAMSASWHGGRRAGIGAQLRAATLRQSAATIAAAMAMWLSAPWLLALFGPGFQQAQTALQLLILSRLVGALSGPSDIALNMCGEQRIATRIGLLTMLAAAVALPLGALVAGGTGVAAVVLLAVCLRKGLLWWQARQRLGLRCDALSALRGRHA